VWTRWDARQNALADDGAAIWIGTAMGAVRWDKATNAYHRYTPYDDLPSWSVYAVAVDAMGGRWFGGSEGLTLLDAGGTWTHFDSANSQLLRSPVVGVAAGAGGTIWVSYELPDGPGRASYSNSTTGLPWH
jgi:ligand-binding sensor domain-containing protein